MCLVGCDSKEENKIANPWSEVDSLDMASEITGFVFTVPEKFDGKSISMIQTMDEEIIEVRYGDDIVFRKGKGNDDISGDYNNYDVTLKKTLSFLYHDASCATPDALEVTLRGNGDTYNCVTFSKDGYSYSITSSNGLSLDSISDVVYNGLISW